MKDLLLKLATQPKPIRSIVARTVINRLSLFSYTYRLNLSAIDRPHYGHCIYQAAKLARALQYPKVSVIEFGCGCGKGLISAEAHIAEVMKIIPVDIELYRTTTALDCLRRAIIAICRITLRPDYMRWIAKFWKEN